MQVHVSALRKALGPQRQLLETHRGRGYRLHAHPAADSPLVAPATNLPPAGAALIGRDADIADTGRAIAAHRLVTLTGPAGIGKTRLALDAARASFAGFSDGVFFVELAPIAEVDLVPRALALALGLDSRFQTSHGIAQALRERHMLIVLDNCEHIIEGAAQVADMLLQATSHVRVLATSRAPLQVDGEQVRAVAPLAFPAAELQSPSAVLASSAVQLFLARARGAGVDLDIAADPDACRAVAEIARRLDGIPLAIELAAARARSLGVAAIRDHLDDRLRLLGAAAPGGVPRHQTLRTAFDWSHAQLSWHERVVFARLSVFAGPFDMRAAAAVGATDAVPAMQVLTIVDELAAKSLLVVHAGGTLARHGMLDSMRLYAGEQLAAHGDPADARIAHLRHLTDVLEEGDRDLRTLSTSGWLRKYGRWLDELRSALAWSLAHPMHADAGARLAALTTNLWTQMSLEAECIGWVERLFDAARARGQPVAARDAMRLHIAHAKSVLYGMNTYDSAEVSFSAGYQLARALDDTDYALRALWGLIARMNSTDRIAQGTLLAGDFLALARSSGDPFDMVAADRTMGAQLYFSQDLDGARRHLQRAIDTCDDIAPTAHQLRYGVAVRAMACYTLGQVLWLGGRADAALALAAGNLEDSERIGHAMTLCTTLGASTIPLHLHTGKLAAARLYVDQLMRYGRASGIDHWINVARFYGAVLDLPGDPRAAVAIMEESEVHLNPTVLIGSFFIPIRVHRAWALHLTGDSTAGLAVLATCFDPIQLHGRKWHIPEMLRLQGEMTLGLGAIAQAEQLFERAMALARTQQALSLELRAANSLARLWRSLGEGRRGATLIASVQARFEHVQDTGDWQESSRLLAPGPTLSP